MSIKRITNLSKYLQRSSPLSLTKIILLTHQRKNDSYKRTFPKNIGKYTFVRTISKIGTRNNFSFGVYKNTNNVLYFAKMWSGKEKGVHYNELINEIRAYLTLNVVAERVRKNVPSLLKSVRIPSLVEVHEAKGVLIILTEYKSGELASTKSHSIKIDAYMRITEYLKFLGQNMTKDEKAIFSQRSVFSYIFLFPMFLILSIKNNPENIGTFFTAALNSIRAFFYLTLYSEQVLSHRDLHFKNILIDNKAFVLIDLQLMVWTEVLVEYATTYRYTWGINGFEHPFYSAIQEKFKGRKHFINVFRGLVIHSATHGLIDNSFPSETTSRWVALIDCMTNNFQKRKFVPAI